MERTYRLSLLYLLAFFVASPSAHGFVQIPGAVHLHTNISSGNDSLDELVERARRSGIEAIVLTDNYLLKFEYGLFPLRNLVRKRVEMPSVLKAGPERYLALIKETQRRYPEMILIPGVEVIPHYYWTGSLYQGNLTMHNGQKNLLVVGFERPQEYLGLPVIGNDHAASPLRWTTAAYLLPGLLLPPGIWLLRRKYKRTLRVGMFLLTEKRSFRWQGLLLILVGLVWLANNYPFIQRRLTPYQRDVGMQPYQDLIAYVKSRGGLTFWSLPEARDHHVIDYGRLGSITVKTEPYSEELVNTDDYTGFGAMVADNSTMTDPGDRWDRILAAYLAGVRPAPVWAIGEIAYHGEGEGGTRLPSIETVFLVTEKTKEGVLWAMRKGRMYARHRTAEYGLILNDFSLLDEGSGKKAFSGDLLEVEGAGPIAITIEVTTTDGRSRPLRGVLIRSGEVLQIFRGKTPFQVSYRDQLPGEGAYYRLDIREGPDRILSNPIFVQLRDNKKNLPEG